MYSNVFSLYRKKTRAGFFCVDISFSPESTRLFGGGSGGGGLGERGGCVGRWKVVVVAVVEGGRQSG